jgi:hypothetical protein
MPVIFSTIAVFLNDIPSDWRPRADAGRASAEAVVIANASPFHGENRGSIPLGRANKSNKLRSLFADLRRLYGNYTENPLPNVSERRRALGKQKSEIRGNAQQSIRGRLVARCFIAIASSTFAGLQSQGVANAREEIDQF